MRARSIVGSLFACATSAAGISYGGALPLSGEIAVNTFTTGHQTGPRVAATPDGGYLVVWASEAQDGDGYGVFARCLEADGTAAAAEFQVNAYTTGNQFAPAVSVDFEGRAVVVWTSFGQDGSAEGVFARRFPACAPPDDDEFRVDAYTTSSQRDAAVAPTPDGGFVVAWQGYGPDASTLYDEVRARRYDSAGRRRGGAFQVSGLGLVNFEDPQHDPQIEVHPDGDFTIVWSNVNDFDELFSTTRMQRFGADGSIDGPERDLGLGAHPVIAAHAAGFVVVNAGFGADYYRDVFAMRFDEDGRFLDEHLVSEFTAGSQGQPAVTAFDDGAFVVAWQSDAAPFEPDVQTDVFARVHDPSGIAPRDEIRVNEHTTGLQAFPDVDAQPNGDLVVVWESDEQDGSGAGVFARRLADLACPPHPLDGCAQADRSSLQVRRHAPSGRCRLAWNWLGDGSAGEGSFGAPDTDTAYFLCAYDSSDAGPWVELALAPGDRWSALGDVGFKYEDRTAAQDGVALVKLAESGFGTRIRLRARGRDVPVPRAQGTSPLVEVGAALHVQLVTTRGACWSVRFDAADLLYNRADGLKASEREH